MIVVGYNVNCVNGRGCNPGDVSQRSHRLLCAPVRAVVRGLNVADLVALAVKDTQETVREHDGRSNGIQTRHCVATRRPASAFEVLDVEHVAGVAGVFVGPDNS